MSEAPFQACWHRLDRAEAHRIAMTQIWNDFITDHPYDTSLDHEGDGVFILRVWQTSPIPPELAVITGEWIYNLRCALDYIVWATACYQSGAIPPPNEGTLQYPIYESADAWTRNLYRLKPLAEHHRAMLEQMQPFNSDPDANYLGWINRLARIDRHRRLSIVTSYLAELNPGPGSPGRLRRDAAVGQSRAGWRKGRRREDCRHAMAGRPRSARQSPIWD